MTAAGARGRFLVFEGPDGCGKTTQVRLLGDRLAKVNVPHLLVREPGGTAVGEAIRPVILQGADMPPRSELLLYLAARAALVEERIRPALEEGKLVIADRYFLSSRRKPDRIERADAAFHERVRRGYAELAAADDAIEVIDADGGVRAVHRAILAVLRGRWPETFASGSV